MSRKRTDNMEISAEAGEAFIYLGTGRAGVAAKKHAYFFLIREKRSRVFNKEAV